MVLLLLLPGPHIPDPYRAEEVGIGSPLYKYWFLLSQVHESGDISVRINLVPEDWGLRQSAAEPDPEFQRAASSSQGRIQVNVHVQALFGDDEQEEDTDTEQGSAGSGRNRAGKLKFLAE